jgi:steroid 5-alpha reductase family enzyme
MSALIFIWGVRLTRNFARKGGYNRGEEDYRWAVLREKKILNSKFGWLLFNFSFICFYQHALLFLITAPCAWAATPYAQKIPLNEYDLYATLLFLFFFNLERVADNQQWRFQQAKYGKAKREAKYETDYQNGFLSKGLFARSRHPNFFSEQMIWWSLWVRVAAIVLGGERKLVLVAFTEDAEVLRIVFFRVHPWSQVWLRGFARVLCRCGFVIFVVPRIDGVYRANHGGEVPDLQRVPKEGE